MIRKCYIAGPMTSRPEFNYPAFMEAASRLREAGWVVFNPAEEDDREERVSYRDLCPTIEDQKDMMSNYRVVRRFVKRDIGIIVNKLNPIYRDAIVVLDGWEESKGAMAEIAVGHWLGLRVLDLEEAISEGPERHENKTSK